MSCSLCGPFAFAHYTHVASRLLLRVLVPCKAKVEPQHPCLSYRPFTPIHTFLTERTLQAKKDVTGASNPFLEDSEESKKGEGITESAKVVVSCIHIDIQSGDGF